MKLFSKGYRVSLFKALPMFLLVALMSFSTLACGGDDQDKTATSTTPTIAAPSGQSPSGYDDQGQDGTATPENDTDGEDGDGADEDDSGPTIVNTTDTYGPCIDGMQEVTHYTEYSDGTAASSTAMVPCGDDISPVEP